MLIDNYFEFWMQTVYPHRKYVNVLSHKWVKRFAQDFHEQKMIMANPSQNDNINLNETK